MIKKIPIFTLVFSLIIAGCRKETDKPSSSQSPPGWVELKGSAGGGGISDTSTVSAGPALALDSSGRPAVAWMNRNSGNYEIYVKRYDGSNWVELGPGSAFSGGISNNMGESMWPAIAVDPSGNPIVAWEDDTFGIRKIYIKRWDPRLSAWVEVGDESASGYGISGRSEESRWPSLALDSSGNPWVAYWAVAKGMNVIYARFFNGVDWVGISRGISRRGESRSPSLAIDSSGNPILAWADVYRGDMEIYVKRWDGKRWSETGKNSASRGGISRNGGNSGLPRLAVDRSGNPVVAWEDNSSGNSEIYVLRWDGENWIEIGRNSASGGGISNSPGKSGRPSLALDIAGNPVVAWEEENLGNREIWVRRWSGGAWVEIGGASASGGGISNNPGASESPALAIDSKGNPTIVWRDNTSGSWQIYLKRYQTTISPP